MLAKVISFLKSVFKSNTVPESRSITSEIRRLFPNIKIVSALKVFNTKKGSQGQYALTAGYACIYNKKEHDEKSSLEDFKKGLLEVNQKTPIMYIHEKCELEKLNDSEWIISVRFATSHTMTKKKE